MRQQPSKQIRFDGMENKINFRGLLSLRRRYRIKSAIKQKQKTQQIKGSCQVDRRTLYQTLTNHENTNCCRIYFLNAELFRRQTHLDIFL